MDLWTLSVLLSPGHVPFHVVFRTDNSPSQSAAWRGLSLARGMCQFLRSFNTLQEAVRISVHLDSVPGFLNDTADALSRGVPPSSLGFKDSEIFTVPWTSFPASPLLEFYPSSDLMSAFVAAELPAQLPLDLRASEMFIAVRSRSGISVRSAICLQLVFLPLETKSVPAVLSVGSTSFVHPNAMRSGLV